MRSFYKLFVLFFVYILCSRAQTVSAESNTPSVIIEENEASLVSQGLIQYHLQATDTNTAHVDSLISNALNFEIARKIDNVIVTASPYGFEIQYSTLSSDFLEATRRLIERIEELLRSGHLEAYLDTARANLRQTLNTAQKGRQSKGPNGAATIRGMNNENHFSRRKRTAVLAYFRQRKEQLSNESVVRFFGRSSNAENDALRITKILNSLKRKAPSHSADLTDKPDTSLMVQPEIASVTAIDGPVDGNQLLLRFIQSVPAEYTKSERTGAVLAQFTVRELQFGVLATALFAEGATIVQSQKESLEVKNWYELTVRCPKDKVGKVVTLVRNQWEHWVRKGMHDRDSRAGLALARTRIAIAATTPYLRLRLKANQGSLLKILTNRSQSDDFVAESSMWIEQISDRLRTDLDPSRLSLEVHGDINGYTLTQLSNTYPEARLIVVRPE
ncbi:MAG: hypothetical protein VYC39_08015 [Myxococcota bacterium]|nr:hypothetical protein [Myxococcota bacterium]